MRHEWSVSLLGVAVLLVGCDPSSPPAPHVEHSAPVSPHLSTTESLPQPYDSPSGQVISLAVAGTGRGMRVYAGTRRGGVWTSRNGGLNWTQSTLELTGGSSRVGGDAMQCADRTPVTCGLPMLEVSGLAAAATDSNTAVVALTNDIHATNQRDGVYTTTDGGTTWRLAHQFNCGNGVVAPHAVAIAPDDATLAFATSDCGVAFGDPASTNQWQSVSLPDAGAAWWIAVATAGQGSRRVYVCNLQDGMYVSFNGGAAFTKEQTNTNRFCDGVAVVPNHPQEIYVMDANGGTPWAYGRADPRHEGRTLPIRRCLPPDAACGPKLYFAEYAAGSANGRWQRVGTGPYYNAPAHESAPAFLAVHGLANDRHLVVLSDTGSVQASVGVPTYESWHRLDGPDGNVDSAVHVDPHGWAAADGLDLTLVRSARNDLAEADAGNAPPPGQVHNLTLASCSNTPMFLANDGGVYRSSDCGRTWRVSEDLEALNGTDLAGFDVGVTGALTGGAGAGDTGVAYGPSLYFGAQHNDAWASRDGGRSWSGGVSHCGDCSGFWADPLEPDRIYRYRRGNSNAPDSLEVYRSTDGLPPQPAVQSTTMAVDLGGPPTIYRPGAMNKNLLRSPWGAAFLLRHLGQRPLVYSLPADRSQTPDVVTIAPVATNNDTLRVWRKRSYEGAVTEVSPYTGLGWRVEDAAPVPRDAVVVQASGGHRQPTYFVADLATTNGTTAQLGTTYPNGTIPRLGSVPEVQSYQTNRLWRSHRAGNRVDGWDCVVPGPVNAAIHDGRCVAQQAPPANNNCLTSATAANCNGRPRRAWAYQVDPYRPNIVYVLDDDGIDVSTDGGDTWNHLGQLSAWASDYGDIPAACRGDCSWGQDRVFVFSHMHFVPDEPGTRFFTGATGVYYTVDGDTAPGAASRETWHRLLDSDAVNCMANSSYFHRYGSDRDLYVLCTGRSLLKFSDIPRGPVVVPRRGTLGPLTSGSSSSSRSSDVISHPPIISTVPSKTLPVPPITSKTEPKTEPPPSKSSIPPPTKEPPPNGEKPIVKFTVQPPTVELACSGTGALLPFQLILDANGSNLAINWTIVPEEHLADGTEWAIVDPFAGQVKPGTNVVVTVAPDKRLCGELKAAAAPVQLHLFIDYAWGQIEIPVTVAPPGSK